MGRRSRWTTKLTWQVIAQDDALILRCPPAHREKTAMNGAQLFTAHYGSDDRGTCDISAQKNEKQILRLTTPRLKSTPGAPFAQDDKQFV